MWRKLSFFVLPLFIFCQPVRAQSVQYLPCISNTACSAANALRGHLWSGTPPSAVIVGGYNAPNDGGAGEFVLGVACPNFTGPLTVTTTVGSANVIVATGSTSGLAPGY